MTTIYRLNFWRDAQRKTAFQEGWYEGWYHEDDYLNPSEVRAAIVSLQVGGHNLFQILEITTKVIPIDYLEILSDS